MNQLHFTINLNKYGELKQQAEAEKKIFINFTIFFFVIAALLYGGVLYINYRTNVKLENRKNAVIDLKKQVSQYVTSGDYLSARDLERLTATSTDRVFWARKLVAFSEDTNEKIAVTHFSFKNNILSLYGITKVESEEKEYDLINDYINTLKANKDISVDFPEIKFVRSTRDKEKDADIIRFQIDAFGKKSPRRGGVQ
ncbi:MAG: hypothetical protein PHY08_01550 [Candidatus Cloacimonetes bacterium]|jgi:hypothetical protein|nr:hypothetical protein [Candidatus Cloacimonadota bacterium]